jgi:DNA-binding response OmpR family regulator
MAHLLIVEDDELLRDALATRLMQAGYSVVSAANGAVARKLLNKVC